MSAAIRAHRRIARFVFAVPSASVPVRRPRGRFGTVHRRLLRILHRHVEEGASGKTTENVVDRSVAGIGGKNIIRDSSDFHVKPQFSVLHDDVIS